MPTERPPIFSEVVPTFAERGCCVETENDVTSYWVPVPDTTKLAMAEGAMLSGMSDCQQS
jgi:hypothetical protein